MKHESNPMSSYKSFLMEHVHHSYSMEMASFVLNSTSLLYFQIITKKFDHIRLDHIAPTNIRSIQYKKVRFTSLVERPIFLYNQLE